MKKGTLGERFIGFRIGKDKIIHANAGLMRIFLILRALR